MCVCVCVCGAQSKPPLGSGCCLELGAKTTVCPVAWVVNLKMARTPKHSSVARCGSVIFATQKYGLPFSPVVSGDCAAVGAEVGDGVGGGLLGYFFPFHEREKCAEVLLVQ